MQGMIYASATVCALPAASHLPSLGVWLIVAVCAGLGLLSCHGYAAPGVEVLHARLLHLKRRRRHHAAALAPRSWHAVSDLRMNIRLVAADCRSSWACCSNEGLSSEAVLLGRQTLEHDCMSNADLLVAGCGVVDGAHAVQRLPYPSAELWQPPVFCRQVWPPRRLVRL